MPLQLAVDLVNSLDVVDNLETLDVTAVVGMLDRAEIDNPPETSEADLVAVRALRARVRQVFESTSLEGAVESVNRILQQAHAVPFVGVHGMGPHLHVAPRKPDPAG